MTMQDTHAREDGCVFCEIISGQCAARIVCETADVLCFLPLKVEVLGHTLIVPKVHFADVYDAPKAALAAVATASKDLAIAYRRKIGATGANFLNASGKDAEQSVFHFHVHLLPRFARDGLSTWPRLPQAEFDHDAVLAQLLAD